MKKGDRMGANQRRTHRMARTPTNLVRKHGRRTERKGRSPVRCMRRGGARLSASDVDDAVRVGVLGERLRDDGLAAAKGAGDGAGAAQHRREERVDDALAGQQRHVASELLRHWARRANRPKVLHRVASLLAVELRLQDHAGSHESARACVRASGRRRGGATTSCHSGALLSRAHIDGVGALGGDVADGAHGARLEHQLVRDDVVLRHLAVDVAAGDRIADLNTERDAKRASTHQR
eukprot:6191336-Pleurochrysis_carterae.AAC.2